MLDLIRSILVKEQAYSALYGQLRVFMTSALKAGHSSFGNEMSNVSVFISQTLTASFKRVMRAIGLSLSNGDSKEDRDAAI